MPSRTANARRAKLIAKIRNVLCRDLVCRCKAVDASSECAVLARAIVDEALTYHRPKRQKRTA